MNEVEVYDEAIPSQTDATDPFEPTGVLLMERIPPHKFAPAPYKWTCKDLIEVLREWSNTDSPLEPLLKERHIKREIFYRIMERYPEVRTLYQFARKSQAPILTDKLRGLYDQIPPEAYETGKDGNKRLSQPYITWMRDKAAVTSRLSAVYESGTTLQKQIVESTNRSISIQLTGKMPRGVTDKALALEDLLH